MSQPEAPNAGEPEIHGVVFSRDRAMQLDALLSSFSRQCADAAAVELSVLYLASSPAFARQYATVERRWRDALHITFHQEHDFRTDVMGIIDCGDELLTTSLRNRLSLLRRLGRDSKTRRDPPAVQRYVLFLVDDSVFYRPFSVAVAKRALAAFPGAIGFSLRLGRNTTYCYSLDRPQRLPAFKRLRDDVLAFDWVGAECDFGYPLEVSSSIYPIRQVATALKASEFSNPNTLESQLAGAARRFRMQRYPELLCFEQSVCFCNAVNKVQTTFSNRAGEHIERSSSELARKFDSGLRIDIDAFAGFTPIACHCDVAFSFVLDEGRNSGGELDSRT